MKPRCGIKHSLFCFFLNAMNLFWENTRFLTVAEFGQELRKKIISFQLIKLKGS
jgi:hypothetical protein